MNPLNPLKRAAAALHLLEPMREVRDTAKTALRRVRWVSSRRFGKLDRELIAEHMRGTSPRRLHLGAGNHELDGWLNSDLYPRSPRSIHLDARQPFPIADDRLAFVFSNHMIEHMAFPDGSRMLAECFRVLEPGGVLRVSTPDFAFLLRIYADSQEPLIAQYLDWQLEWMNRDTDTTGGARDPIFVINNFVRDWGHEFIYDRAVLRDAMASAGFVEIVQCSLNQSDHEPLRDIEHASRAPEGFVELETMTFEGRKPVRRDGAPDRQAP